VFVIFIVALAVRTEGGRQQEHAARAQQGSQSRLPRLRLRRPPRTGAYDDGSLVSNQPRPASVLGPRRAVNVAGVRRRFLLASIVFVAALVGGWALQSPARSPHQPIDKLPAAVRRQLPAQAIAPEDITGVRCEAVKLPRKVQRQLSRHGYSSIPSRTCELTLRNGQTIGFGKEGQNWGRLPGLLEATLARH
jgi:hypothetical protein